MISCIRYLALVLGGLTSMLIGCGGESSSESSPVGGGPQGGTASSGTNAGGTGPGGTKALGGMSGAGGAPTVCCNGMPMCNSGDSKLTGGSSCPPGGTCYSRSLCCETITCLQATAQCEAMPVCDPGDSEVAGACPPDLSCYTRSLCGTTINCRRSTSGCDPSIEYYRNYLGTSPAQCQTMKFTCPSNTTMFSNDCGCGCEQAANCPSFVDCMPGPSVDRSPLCTNSADCPYTTRAM